MTRTFGRISTAAAGMALLAGALLANAPAAAAGTPTPPSTPTATNDVVKIGKLTPEQTRTMDAAGAERTAFSPQTDGRRLCFQAHSRTGGWSAAKCSDSEGYTGTEGQNDPIDVVRFWVGTTGALNFNVQVHWANDGNSSEYYVAPGNSIELSNIHGNPLQAIHLRSTNETMKAAAHVQNVGWKGTNQWSYDQWIGSIGENRWMEAFWIDI
ncbi:hypothetical protein ACWEQL_35295 [Kitasatospora sp. NPDC004240]